MPSPTGSKIPLLIVGALSLTALGLGTVNAIKEDISYNAGAQIITDDIYFATNSEKPYGCIQNNTGASLCFASQQMSVSGSYIVAEIQVPAAFSGSYLTEAYFDCGDTPINLSGSLAIHQNTKEGLSAGTILRRAIATSTGSTTIANTGATITTKIPGGQYITFVMSGGVTSNFTLAEVDCKMDVRFREKHGR